VTCKLKEVQQFFTTSLLDKRKTLTLTETPVICPICDKTWIQAWCEIFVTDRAADGFCSDECRKKKPEGEKCGHYLCNISGPVKTEEIPNPYYCGDED
jgi:hypothetical protein